MCVGVFMKDRRVIHECVGADCRSSVFIFCPFHADIGVGSDSVCARHSSAHRIKSFESLSCQASLGRSSKLLQNQFRSLVRTTLTNSTLQEHDRYSAKERHRPLVNLSKHSFSWVWVHYVKVFLLFKCDNAEECAFIHMQNKESSVDLHHIFDLLDLKFFGNTLLRA